MRLPFLSRFAPFVVAAILLASPVLFFGAAKAVGTNSNRVLDWLPRSFEETQRLLWFVERFGSDELLAAGWPGCSIDAPQVEEFVRLASERKQNNSSFLFFREVTSGQHVLDELTKPPLNLPDGIAKQRMSSWILGPDGKATCIIARIQPSEDKVYDRVGAYRCLQEIAAEVGIPADDLRIAGPTADKFAIDEAGAKWTVQMGIASMLTGCFLAWICLRAWWDVLAIFVTSLLAASASLAIVFYSGYKMDSVLMTMPALVFVLTTSGGIHLTHYLREGLKEVSSENAPLYAIRIGWLPCTLACVTTMIGLGSLAVSRVTPVIRFGTFSALGVVVCLLFLLSFWPCVSLLLARLRPKQRHEGFGKNEWWEPLFRFATQRWGVVLGAAALLFPLLIFGLARTNTSVHTKDLLPKASNLLSSYGWLQEKIGPLVPVEVVMSFPEDRSDETRKTMVSRAAMVEALRQRIEKLEMSGGCIAATTFAPELPLGSGARNTMLRRVVDRHLAKNRDRLVDIGFLRDDVSGDQPTSLWRISTRVSSEQSDYSVFLSELEKTVEGYLAEVNADRDGNTAVSAQVCGAIPLIQMAQRQLLIDLIQSFILAFALIGLTMMLMLRRPSAGLVAMIPNVFPTVVVFGLFGLRGKAIDIGTMMTASVALGIAVDDTLHFLYWVRKAMEAGATRLDAIRQAFRRSASAVLQTSVICGVGLAPFVVSPFGPLSRFAGGMFALLGAALVGDLLLLPALVASPLGRLFAPKVRDGSETVGTPRTSNLEPSPTVIS